MKSLTGFKASTARTVTPNKTPRAARVKAMLEIFLSTSLYDVVGHKGAFWLLNCVGRRISVVRCTAINIARTIKHRCIITADRRTADIMDNHKIHFDLRHDDLLTRKLYRR